MNYMIVIETANDGSETATELAYLLRYVADLVDYIPTTNAHGFLPPTQIDLYPEKDGHTGRCSLVPQTDTSITMRLSSVVRECFSRAANDFAAAERGEG